MKLDLKDLKILKSLQNNSKITNIELSKVIGLSAAPTLGRVQKLEKAIQSRLKVNLSSKIMITYGYEFYYSSNEINPINSHEFLLTFRSSIVEKLKRSTIISYF